MIEALQRLSLPSKIVTMFHCHEGVLGVVCVDKRLFLIDTHEWQIRKRFEFSRLGDEGSLMALSHNTDYFAYAHGHEVYVIDLRHSQLLHVISLQRHSATQLAFDEKSRYLLVGTDEGRVWLWRANEKASLARVATFPEHSQHMILPLQNYVSALQTSGSHYAAAGYGDSVVVGDISTMKTPKRLYLDRSKINTIAFLSSEVLFCGNEEGRISKVYVNEERPHRQGRPSLGAIRHLVLMRERGYILAASSHRHVALLDAHTLEVLDNSYVLMKEDIASLALEGESLLYLASVSGALYSVSLVDDSALQEAINAERFETAYALVKANPLLERNGTFEGLRQRFEEHLDEARQVLLQHNDKAAHQLLHPFSRIGVFKQQIDALFYAFNHYPRLQFLVKNGHFSMAYDLAESYADLKQTPEFGALEAQWERYFKEAQKFLLRAEEAKARKLLEPFRGVKQKSALTELLLKMSTKIADFSRAIADHDFGALHALVRSYPELKMMPSYRQLFTEAETLYGKFMEAVSADMFAEAEGMLLVLEELPQSASHWGEMRGFVHKARKLQQLHSAHQWRGCYEMIDSDVRLGVLPRSKLLESRWLQSMLRCEARAFEGDAKSVLSYLRPLLPLHSRHERMGNILRLTYRTQLGSGMLSREKVHAGIAHYLEIFGGDSEIRALMARHQLERDAPQHERGQWLSHYTRLPDFIYEAI